jgi:hypothetical protein
MKNLYHIVTRFTRNEDPSIEWLDNCYNSIIKTNINFKWYIIGVPEFWYTNKYSNTTYIHFPYKPNWKNMCNYYLDMIPDEGQWVYILDDDNKMHPNFGRINKKLEDDTKLFIVSQRFSKDDTRIASEENIMVSKIDMAQFCIKREIIGDLRFWEIYRGDGYFIMEQFTRCKEYGYKCQIFPEIMSYHNAQHWIC